MLVDYLLLHLVDFLGYLWAGLLLLQGLEVVLEGADLRNVDGHVDLDDFLLRPDVITLQQLVEGVFDLLDCF